MIICEEMKKLRAILDEKGIAWVDSSEDLELPFMDWWICRTHFDYKKYHVSVINGHGSYGGFMVDEKQNEGLLEMMTNMVNGGDPVGYLAAEEIMELLEKEVTV